MPVFDLRGAPAAADREPAEQISGTFRGRRDEMVIATKSNGIVGLDINDRACGWLAGLAGGVANGRCSRRRRGGRRR